VRFVGQPTDTTARAQTRKAIKRMMLTRGMQVGDKMPTYRELAEQFGVALLTIQRVMRDLAEEGLIYRLHSKGAFIKRVLESDGQLSQVGLLYPAAMGRLDLGRYQRVCRAFDEQGRFAPAMAARDLLGLSEQPTAVLTDDTYQAAALHRCLGELGIRIPRDLSMAAGIGARGDPLVGNQALTFARGDFRGMGWRAIEILQMQAAGRQSALRGVERIATTLVIGTTTARPRPHARIE
jgi:hypothetical protein